MASPRAANPDLTGVHAVVRAQQGNRTPASRRSLATAGRTAYDVDVAEPQPRPTGTVGIFPPP